MPYIYASISTPLPTAPACSCLARLEPPPAILGAVSDEPPGPRPFTPHKEHVPCPSRFFVTGCWHHHENRILLERVISAFTQPIDCVLSQMSITPRPVQATPRTLDVARAAVGDDTWQGGSVSDHGHGYRTLVGNLARSWP